MNSTPDDVHSEKKIKETAPSPLARCIVLARGSHVAGVLLAAIIYWFKYASKKLPKAEGNWIAHKRTWWMREAQLSRDQIDRALRKLDEWDLIERRQWWFGNRNILYVRPTPLATNFIHATTTWAAVHEFTAGLACSAEGGPGHSKKKKVTSAETVNSNGVSTHADPGSATNQNSNNINNVLDKQIDIPSNAFSASPSCVMDETLDSTSGENKETTKKKIKNDIPHTSFNGVTTLFVANVWIAAYNKYVAKESANDLIEGLAGKDLGHIALLLKSLRETAGWGHLENNAANILAFMIQNWDHIDHYGKPELPTVQFACENLEVDGWLYAGSPTYSTPQTEQQGPSS